MPPQVVILPHARSGLPHNAQDRGRGRDCAQYSLRRTWTNGYEISSHHFGTVPRERAHPGACCPNHGARAGPARSTSVRRGALLSKAFRQGEPAAHAERPRAGRLGHRPRAPIPARHRGRGPDALPAHIAPAGHRDIATLREITEARTVRTMETVEPREYPCKLRAGKAGVTAFARLPPRNPIAVPTNPAAP